MSLCNDRRKMLLIVILNAFPVPSNQDTAIISYPKYFLLGLMGLRIFDPIILVTQAEWLAYTIF